MPHIKNLFIWLDEHIIEITAGFLLVFIPLYPKWPLADLLPGYIVRLRLEDIFIALVFLVWLVQLGRKKVELKKNPLLIPILIYLAIGFISSLSALFITKTVPLERLHMAKLFLHWLRRFEYMSLAFIFFSAVKTKEQLKRYISILFLVIVVTTIYGLGQKYLQWPVYSTMNREFAKGWRLVLTEHARAPSTFAGHYDFAAFSVIALAISASLWLSSSFRRSKWSLFVFLAAFVSLLLTASRTSFIAYLVAITTIIILFSRIKGIRWGFPRWIGLLTFSIVGMLIFGDLSQRFAHFFKLTQIREYFETRILHLDSLKKPGYNLSDDLALVYTQTDQPPLPFRREGELPPDVFENIPEAYPEATLSATGADKDRVASLAGKPRTYSPAAFTFGLSSAIRFDALWPRAIKGFLKNPLLGSGYSTLVKTEITEFTEAESTDNDYLRALGETGILGFLSFYAILFLALKTIWEKERRITDPLLLAVMIGIGGAIVGMLVNSMYIDVFEASKVAYLFWAIMGILFATVELVRKKMHYEHR